MGEYQYYEFLAIDRPLTYEEMKQLRDISSRARISPSSFVNEYNFGSLKADPRDLMKHFFDAHVYVTNWMSARFILRLPKESFDHKTLSPFTAYGIFKVEASPSHWLLIWSLEESENYDRFGEMDCSGWMARLSPLREELLRGDLRGLYIGWLAAVTQHSIDEDDLEPLGLAGLGKLTAAQRALAEFLEVDVDLLGGAGIGSPSLGSGESVQNNLDVWLKDLPQEEILGYLLQMLTGEGQLAEQTLRSRFAAWQRQAAPPHQAPTRTVHELWLLAEQGREQRLEQEAVARRKREEQQRKKREAYLASLANDFPKAWKTAQLNAEVGSGKAYDMVCQQLVDLADAYRIHSSKKEFDTALKRFLKENSKRKALVERLIKAGLWQIN
ncbi:MAG: hypothetical protein A4E72_02116 [Syntrophus sp. PtaU1.Bin208]|nr:MAG: hypothetical protein A4E72_02116 [Syntrophus sp. PtaU1.Bin208]